LPARLKETLQSCLDLSAFPVDQPETSAYVGLVDRCRADVSAHGLCNLEGFLQASAAGQIASALEPEFATNAFRHARRHNIFFKKSVPGLATDDPALTEFETVNHTLCEDQLAGTLVSALYHWPPMARFLADVMAKSALFPMRDPLAGVNAMAYGDGEALNWHFDRSEFTVTLLLQAPKAGGVFEYRTDLRTPDDPNFAGIARLVSGEDQQIETMEVAPGTLNVFRGVNTPHRVTPVVGDQKRIIAVFSYYDRPGVRFSDEERLGFYGRAE
jgi:hypothetical protein